MTDSEVELSVAEEHGAEFGVPMSATEENELGDPLLSSVNPAAARTSKNVKLSCRMYENPFPEVNDLVMVNVKQIAEMGAYVTLTEYNNIEGMVLLSELTRRRIRSVQRLIRVGKSEIVVVLRVDREKGYIDLSKRRVSPEEAEKFEEKFNKSKTVHSILRHVAEQHDVPLEQLYVAVGWPLYRKFGHAFDAFKLALSEPDKVWGALDTPLDARIKEDIIASIVRRLSPNKVKVRADVEVACFAYDGIDAVKAALRAGESMASEEFPLKIRLVAPPLYVITCVCMDKTRGIEHMYKTIEHIDTIIRTMHGFSSIKMKPKSVSELDDRELDNLIKQSEKENAEVSGDENSSEEEHK